MNALKNLSLILLLSLAFTGCHNKSSKINDFNLLLYAPEYASGFSAILAKSVIKLSCDLRKIVLYGSLNTSMYRILFDLSNLRF